MSTKLSCSIILLLAAEVFATNKVGNGGNVVVCKERAGSRYELLDFFESETKIGDIHLLKKTPQQIIELTLEKLRPASKELAEQYLKRSRTIESEFEFKANIQLIDVKDSFHAFVPKSENCKVTQTIIRKLDITGQEKRFLVDESVWNQLDSFQKAGLILHEIIYEHFYKLGEKDSIKARKLNSYLFQNKPESKGFWQFIRELDVPIYP